MTAYLVTDADLTALSAYRGPALVGEARRYRDSGLWYTFGSDAGIASLHGVTLAEAIAFLRTTCGADTIRAESSFKLPADPPIVVAFRQGKFAKREPAAALRIVLRDAARHGLRCVGGVETPERQGVRINSRDDKGERQTVDEKTADAVESLLLAAHARELRRQQGVTT